MFGSDDSTSTIRKMPQSPQLNVPAFGAWLRDDVWPGASYGEVANRLRIHLAGLSLKVDRSSIVALEKGRVPSWPMLLAIHAAYRVSIPDLVAKLVDALADDARLPLSGNRTDTSTRGLPLGDTKGYKGASQPFGGVSHGPSARTLVVRLRAYQALAKKIDRLSRALTAAIAAADPEIRQAAQTRSGTRSRR